MVDEKDLEEKWRNAQKTVEKAFHAFHKLIRDKVLKENKSDGAKKNETHAVGELVKACVALDQANVGEGIMALAITALREHLEIRDRINELEFELEKMKKEFARMKKQGPGGP